MGSSAGVGPQRRATRFLPLRWLVVEKFHGYFQRLPQKVTAYSYLSPRSEWRLNFQRIFWAYKYIYISMGISGGCSCLACMIVRLLKPLTHLFRFLRVLFLICRYSAFPEFDVILVSQWLYSLTARGEVTFDIPKLDRSLLRLCHLQYNHCLTTIWIPLDTVFEGGDNKHLSFQSVELRYYTQKQVISWPIRDRTS